MSEDWDNLIILDACRFDDFQRLVNISGTLESRISKGTDSVKFIRNNFCGRELHDTVYVTANPHVRIIDDNMFHDVIDDPLSKWDESLRCVTPQSVTDSVTEYYHKYPNKRFIIHYMQPHDPPIGPTAKEIRNKVNISGPNISDQNSGTRMMSAVADGRISPELARKAYRENLRIVLDEVSGLFNKLEGKTVITADHGEMFGENPYPLLGSLYEHFHHPCTLELCKVPWFVIDTGDRRRIDAEAPENIDRVEDMEAEKQLEALGYV